MSPLLLVSLSNTVSAQEKDSTVAKINRFGGAVTIQSKGISTIPNLTLGKPAAVFDMTVGRKLTFEPQFRFSLAGKPWAMVFWWRYKILTGNKFTVDARANTSLSFKTFTDTSSGAYQGKYQDNQVSGRSISTKLSVQQIFWCRNVSFLYQGYRKIYNQKHLYGFIQTQYFKHSHYKEYCGKDWSGDILPENG